MKKLIQELRELECGRVEIAAASPADLFDLEAALVFALAEVKRRRGAGTPPNDSPAPAGRRLNG